MNGEVSTTAGAGAVPTLEPLVGTHARAVLARPVEVHRWVAALGSPLTILLPEQVAGNIAAARAVLDRHGVSGAIRFGAQACPSTTVIRQVSAEGAGVLACSLASMTDALSAGVPGRSILVGGVKTPEMLWLAARAGCTVVVSSLEELREAGALAGRLDVLLRFSSFVDTGAPVKIRPSRSGFAERDFPAIAAELSRHRDLSLRGLSFHLDTVGIPEKALALDGCLRVLREARAAGFSPDVISIGGGFGVTYVADPGQWDAFTTALIDSALGRRAPFTWQSFHYGLRAEKGKLRGAASLYPAQRTAVGARYLDDLLGQRQESSGASFGRILRDSMLELWIEPGRWLVDQAGLTLVRVLRVSGGGSSGATIEVDASSDDLRTERFGVMMDPLLVRVPGSADADVPGPGSGFLVGNRDSESGLITRRAISFRAMPRAGDILAFVNTAGYLADLDSHHVIAAQVTPRGSMEPMRWWEDGRYWPEPVHEACEPGEGNS
ncbi:alanine racemase [Lolliginicoccus suaedae]|uniref:alanine racemase n=1 Tax=Lolliginicoccus suaedae TaxID=2605429 RepID=UPI001CA808C0|nr:alanine racemase [Lolliginicoccus suaedae]